MVCGLWSQSRWPVCWTKVCLKMGISIYDAHFHNKVFLHGSWILHPRQVDFRYGFLIFRVKNVLLASKRVKNCNLLAYILWSWFLYGSGLFYLFYARFCKRQYSNDRSIFHSYISLADC